MASIAVAMVRFHSGTESATNSMRWMPMTMVVMSESVVIRSGQRYWFQPKMNRITESAAMLVRDSGNRMVTKKRSGPAPSTRAASASSSGTVMKNWRNRKVAVAEAISGMVRPE